METLDRLRGLAKRNQIEAGEIADSIAAHERAIALRAEIIDLESKLAELRQNLADAEKLRDAAQTAAAVAVHERGKIMADLPAEVASRQCAVEIATAAVSGDLAQTFFLRSRGWLTNFGGGGWYRSADSHNQFSLIEAFKKAALEEIRGHFDHTLADLERRAKLS